MNEKIKELAIRAGFDLDVHSSNDGNFYGWGGRWINQEITNLVLLAVQDCIDKIETYRIPIGNSAAGEMACEWTYDALKEIRDEIQDQFGLTK